MFLKILMYIIILFLFPFLLAVFIYLKYTVINGKRIKEQINRLLKKPLPHYKEFVIDNPYQKQGKYYKAQLHTHSTNSDGQLSPEELIKRYKDTGYSYLAITDHDKITHCKSEYSDLVIISGEEMTQPRPFWPLGYHISRLFVEEKIEKGNLQSRINKTIQTGGIVVINHPSIKGNLGTQQWLPEELLRLENFFLIEIANYHSSTEDNLLYWHLLLKHSGPELSVWAIGSDDTHQAKDIDQNYIMVQTDVISKEALLLSLRKGSFYPTQGPVFRPTIDGKKLFIEQWKFPLSMPILIFARRLKQPGDVINLKAMKALFVWRLRILKIIKEPGHNPSG